VTSKAALKREQKRLALQEAGIPDDLAWSDMTKDQQGLYLSASMRLYHDRKGTSSQGTQHKRKESKSTHTATADTSNSTSWVMHGVALVTGTFIGAIVRGIAGK
jgi:hypothetical protein